MASNAIFCIDNSLASVNFTGNTPAIGEIWSFYETKKGVTYCVEITSLTDEPSSGGLLQTQYTDCYDCVSQNYYVYNFTNCIDNKIIPIPAYEFSFLPNLYEVYYMTLLYQGNLITGCFSFGSFSNLTPDEFNASLNGGKFASITDTPQLNTGCQACLTSNSLSYEVSRCTDDATDYVLLINDSYIAHLISYSDGVNQYCGTVVGLGSGTPPLTFINDYGLLVKPLSCETCLATENQKVLIQSCTDSGIQEIVWASALYGSEEVSNLSTDDGCFEVIGLTGDPVTINSFLNFDPQPGCEPCIECNGVLYEVSDCDNTVTETVKLYQYLPLDTVFFNPYNNTCYYVNSITTGPESYELYSVETFGLVSSSGCLNCTSTSDVVIWTASICLNNPAIQYNLSVTTDSTAQAGDIVKLMWGSNEWICVELLEIELPGNGGSYYNTVKDGSGTTMIYNGCEDCNSQGLIGVTLVSCGTPQTEQYVSITLDNYLQILNYGSLTNYSVSAINGNCFTITNVCPIPLTVEGFTPVAFYFNCFICSTENQNRVRVAGTEYFECVICCDCGATGSTVTQVTPPHPVWTDGYGNAVTQLNMVSLGGMFGLNN